MLLGGGFFSSKEHEHKPFVLAFQFPDDEKDLVIAFSTPSLMKNMVKTFEKGLRVIHMDGTHKLNNKGYPVIITTDRERAFHPAVFAITKSEKEQSFAVLHVQSKSTAQSILNVNINLANASSPYLTPTEYIRYILQTRITNSFLSFGAIGTRKHSTRS